MSIREFALCVCVGVFSVVVSCSIPSTQVAQLKRSPIDNLEGVITRSGETLSVTS